MLLLVVGGEINWIDSRLVIATVEKADDVDFDNDESAGLLWLEQ